VQPPEVDRDFPSLRDGPLQEALQRSLAVLWVGVIPALLAGLVLRYFVPQAASAGFPAAVSELGHRFALYFGVGLFFLFVALMRYWRFWVPGGRYASVLPAHLVPHEKSASRLAAWADDAALYDLLRSRTMQRRLQRSLGGEERAEVDRRLGALRSGLEEGDAARAAEARRAVERVAGPVLAWRRRRESFALVATVALTGAAVLLVRGRVVTAC
jgi:hypothetical protein